MSSDKASDKAKDAANSASADKAKGHTKEVVGSVQAKVGNLIGSSEMEAKGNMRNAEGKTDRMKGEIKEKIDDAKNMVKAGAGAVKDKFDEVRGK